MSERKSPEINKEARSLLSNLFYNKIVTLEKEDANFPSLSRQLELRRLEDEVTGFINRHPNSSFEVRVLHKNAEDNEHYKVALRFDNLSNKETVTKHTEKYLIVIDSTFGSVTFYEWLLNNVLSKL